MGKTLDKVLISLGMVGGLAATTRLIWPNIKEHNPENNKVSYTVTFGPEESYQKNLYLGLALSSVVLMTAGAYHYIRNNPREFEPRDEDRW